MRTCAFALIMLFGSGIYSIAETNADITVKDVRAAMQNKQFSEAVKLVDSMLSGVKSDRDYLIYLKALSLYYDKKYADATKSCDEIIVEHDKSPWYKKAIFLKAECFIQSKNFAEAEKIYNQEVQRLLSSARKEEIAGVYFRFAEALSYKPGKNELNIQPPNYGKAYEIYRKVLDLEIGDSMKDETMFRLGQMMQLSGNYAQAVNDYHTYLDSFDPDWMGPVDAPQIHKDKDASKVIQGKHKFEARYNLAESLLAMDQFRWARINLENLLNLIPKSENEKLVRDSRLLLVRTYHVPQVRDKEELEIGVKTARTFITDFPNDMRSILLAYDIAQAYEMQGRTDDAVNAYRDFLKLKYDPTMKEPDTLTAEGFEQLCMSSTYRIGDLLLGRKDYTGAMDTWNQYVAQFPNGPQWTDAQRGIVNTEFQIGVDLLAQEKYDEAMNSWNKFIEKYPLDDRSRQIMFAFGQLHYHSAEQAEEKKTDAEPEYRKAIAEWEKLVSKYPNMEESSLALFRIGQIYEEKLMDFEKALESYRKLTWGSWYGEAQNRIRSMTDKKLQLVTERIFRTNEPAKVKLTLRNIEKLTVDMYKLDLEAYWRKTHGIIGVENLDIALISPDKTQEYPIPEYKKYKLFEQYIEVPMDGPGVYAVHVSEDDLEATTLIIRSDVDVIVKTSRQEALVFVEDMVKGEPVSKARVLICDGTKVISEGETGEDGVFQKKIDELKSTNGVSAFVVKDGNVASNSLDISGLGLSSGLTPRGYIYTDRPAYRPGQNVSIRAIIRDVNEGVYTITPDSVYELSITDSQGRLLYSEDLKLSKFGTFDTEFPLDPNAPLGDYQIIAKSKDDESKIYTGTFQVQRYQLEKMKLVIEFPQKVYFRGEKIDVTFKASYYYGQPVTNRMIKYTLPDGRSYTEQVDAEGKLKVTFDTTPMQPDTILTFSGTIEGENIPWTSDHVFLASLEFSISVKPSAEVAISGEPFSVSIETKGADGKSVGKELTLAVYRKVERPAHPILSQMPWFTNNGNFTFQRISEIKVEEHKIVTDEKTGKGSVSLKLDQGAGYFIRASGTDRFNQPISSNEAYITISDDKDAVKLRIVADQSELKVGEKVKIKVHSRLEGSALALLTFEGEGIISHKVQKLNKGWNDVDFTVGNEHFPNFRIAISAMSVEDKNIAPKLVTAEKDFTVERQLAISFKLKEFYSPGEEGEIEVTATDQLGNPVEAELSLALVEEALYAIYPDSIMPITDFFKEGAQRYAGMITVSSCTFRYEPPTRQVIKELLEEAERLKIAEDRAAHLGDTLEWVQQEVSAVVMNGAMAAPAPAAGRQLMARKSAERMRYDEKDKAASGLAAEKYLYAESKSEAEGGGKAGYGLGMAEPSVRQEIPEAGYWLPVIVTDATGKAKVKIPMPEKTTQWRITSRGCTIETIVGQTTTNTITRKDFFLDIKLPSIVTEGDSVRTLVRVHNLTSFEGNVSLNLKLTIDDKDTTDQKQITISKNGTTEVVFKGMLISAGRDARFEVTAKAGDMADGVARTLPIRPWGIEYADNKGGISSGNETIFLQLQDQNYTSKMLTVSIGPSVNRLIFDLVMGFGITREVNFASSIIPMPGDSGSDLLAVAYALDYLKKIGGNATDSKQISERARSLVSSIILSQRDDGGWGWCGIGPAVESDMNVSSRMLWALAEAKKQGITVNPQTMEKAIAYLKSAFARVEQNNDDTKSVILHALSTVGEADFAYANRLYRNRNDMKPATLAYTALTFANLNRNEIGGEVLDVFIGKKLESLDVEIAALGLLAMESIRPDSPSVKQYVDYLLSKRYYQGFSPYKAKGPAVAALATYYGKTQFTKSDYRLTVLANGEKVKEMEVKSEQPSLIIPVPTKLIQDKNKIEFRLEGRGSYAYTATLSGFSPDIKDPKSWDKPYVESRRYYHTPLEYKGRQIAYSSTEITQLPDGNRTNVTVGIKDSYTNRYIVINEYIPAGTVLVNNSVSGNYQYYETGDSMLTFYYLPGRDVRDFSYQLVSYAPGTYKVLPTIIRDAMDPSQMRIGEIDTMEVLAPGEKSKDEYKMNDSELYEFGRVYFEEGNYTDALQMLSNLYDRNREYNQREVARMLLWIHTEEKYYNARKVIEYFEILRERFPELYIPFDKILAVGKAYRDIGEFERAYLVYKATIDASFINDSNVSAVLQDEGQFFNSLDFQENLWREYPDSPQVTSSYFALSQLLYSRVPQAEQLAKTERPMKLFKDSSSYTGKERKITKLDLLKETVFMLSQFLTLYPNDPLADDAIFSMANALLDLEDYPSVVAVCRAAQKRYPESDYTNSFQYVEALGLFWQHKYDEAVNAAKLVAEGKSEDKNLSQYIVGQIYHAQGKPEMAMDWYKKVEDVYPDAKESISYFQEKRISMDEVKIFRPQETVKFTVKYRNIKEVTFQIYRVDLMKLYLREKDLNKISQVHLAGIAPEQNGTITLGDGKDYVDKEREIDLSSLKDDKTYKDGAYLVICRGDDLFTSGLVLVTPLDTEIQEDPGSGRVRVNVRDAVKGVYKEGVHVKAIGSAQKEFKSGKTDLRGLFIADSINGIATVIARENKDTYAFYRGKQWLGIPEGAEFAKKPQQQGIQIESQQADYRANIELQNQAVQTNNFKEFDQIRRGTQKGVQVQKAY
jgi:hypothetical protein